MRDAFIGFAAMVIGLIGLVAAVVGTTKPCKIDPAVLVMADIFHAAAKCTGVK